MKQVILKELRLLNFKGIRQLTISLENSSSEIAGRNGSGKTTIFDAFTWLLFGKDSKDRKTFEIKTLDEKGVAIPRIPHEVSATLLVAGQTVELCRRYKEKWTKRKGQIEEEFTGHEEERLYNDVPCSVKEWNAKIEAICGEQVFKFITSPYYFVSQKTDVQRAMLFRMAGDISDYDIANGNEEFEGLLSKLVGKDMEEYKREIGAKKKRLKAEIESIPERIDERRRDTSGTDTDFAAIERELDEKKEALKSVIKQINDGAEAYSVANNQRLQQAKELGELKSKLTSREYEIKSAVTSEYHKKKEEKDNLNYRLNSALRYVESKKKELQQMKETIPAHQEKRNKLIAEWKEIKALTLQFNESDFRCPTCGRPLEPNDIEAKQREMTEAFNANKAARLSENNRQGLENKKHMESLNNLIASYREDIDKHQREADEIKADPLYKNVLVVPDHKPAVEADETCNTLRNKIAELEEILSHEIVAQKDEELLEAKGMLLTSIDELNQKLAMKDVIARNNQRIAELEESLRNISNEFAELEGIEFTMQAFAKARVEAVENKINSMFSLVSFKMFQQQINGGEVETCEAMINGVPYSSLNNAGQINAGLDIINAICKYEGITAPIFIDNCESVLQPLETEGQQIRLYVSDVPLTINK